MSVNNLDYFDTQKIIDIRKRMLALQVEMAGLVDEFQSLTTYRIRPSYRLEPVESLPVREEEAKAAPGPNAKATAPKPLHQSEVNRAAAHRYMQGNMPDWLPVISEADRKKIGRAVQAFAEAAAKSQQPQGQAESPKKVEAKDTVEFGALLPKAGEPWVAKPQPKGKRISFKGAIEQYRKQHGEEVTHYVLAEMLGEQRTAYALHQAMGTLLGTFPPAEAGAAFAKAHKRTVRTEGDAIRQLANARHKIEHSDGRVTVWSAYVQPGNMGPKSPSATDSQAAPQ